MQIYSNKTGKRKQLSIYRTYIGDYIEHTCQEETHHMILPPKIYLCLILFEAIILSV